MADYNLNVAKTMRQMVIQQVESIPEELLDIQPPQFNNTLRWHIGHIIYSLDSLLALGLPFNTSLPEHYAALFAIGTKPADWKVTPPDKQELLRYLKTQLENLDHLSTDTFSDTLKSPIQLGSIQLKTAGELFHFALNHEAMHLGNMAYMLKVIQHNQK